MFFKRALLGVFGLCVAFALGACSGENEPQGALVDVHLKDGAGLCLNSIDEKISLYLNGTMSDAEVSELWACVDGALDDFVSITAPRHPDGYPPKALARFFENFFVKRDIPLPLAQALMNVKRIFVGGQREFLTTEEITRLRLFIQKARSWSLRLNPHMRTLFLMNPETLRLEDLESAHRELSAVAHELGLWMEGQNQIYTKQEVRELLESLNQWLKPTPRTQALGLFIESLPVFFHLKALLIGGTEGEIRPGEWPLFLQKACSVVSLTQEYQLKSLRHSISALASDRSLANFLSDLSGLFLGVHAPFSDFSALITEASSLSWWPESLSATGLSEGLQYLFQKFLEIDPGRPVMIDERVGQALGDLREDFLSALEPGKNKEFEVFFQSMGDLTSNERGLIVFGRDGKTTFGEKIKRNQLAVIHTVLKRIMKAYGARHAVGRERFHEAFAEVLHRLQAIGLLESVEEGYADRLFREMNVFMKASDGNAVVSESEIGMYAWLVLSAYSQQEWIQSEMPTACREEASCAREFLSTHIERYLENYPGLKTYLLSLSEQGRQEFFQLATQASGSESFLQNFVIFGYLEFFMARFDHDRDEFLGIDEVLSAFEIFGPTLQELLSGLVPPDDVQAFFTFLFHYGYMPGDAGHPGSLLRYLHWKLFPKSWSSHADRMRLLQILSDLNQLT